MKNYATLKWIIDAAKKDGWVVVLLSVVSGLISLCVVWFALISRNVVNVATGAAQGDIWRESSKLLGVLLLQAGLNILQNRLNVQASGRMLIRLNQQLFARLFDKRWTAVNRYHSGDVIARMTSDVSVVTNAVVALVPRWVSMLTRLIACLVVLLMVDVPFTLLLLGVGLSVLLFSRFYGKRMKKIHKECQETDARTRSFLQECVENWLMIQSFGAGRDAGQRLEGLQHVNFRKKVRRNHISSLAHTAIYLLFSGSYYVALAWGAWRLSGGFIDFGTLTAFLQIVHQIQVPFRNMSGITPQYYNMLASAERLMELEDLPEDPKPAVPLDVGKTYAAMRGIHAQGVSFSYDGDPVLSDASITVNKGEFIAVTGGSGIGKSTLLRMLLGFLEPSEGSLFLDTSEGELPIGAGTRPLFAYVPQGHLLFSGTVRQNVTFGCPDAPEEQVWRAAEAAGIGDFIRELPEGMDTLLGERGLGLSEGQVQRLAIARGVLCGAPILLLDEATSALDEKTEAQVLKNLRALPEKTCLCVSHRPAALHICDRAVEIRDGKILFRELRT